jgi:hypothetical protein
MSGMSRREPARTQYSRIYYGARRGALLALGHTLAAHPARRPKSIHKQNFNAI